jgi:hypothetical protein
MFKKLLKIISNKRIIKIETTPRDVRPESVVNLFHKGGLYKGYPGWLLGSNAWHIAVDKENPVIKKSNR